MNIRRPDFSQLGPAKEASPDQAQQRFKSCADLDLLRHAIETNDGGLGNTFASLVDNHQQFGFDTRDPGLVLSVNAHLWGTVFPLLRFGTAQQKEQWLPSLLDGRLIGGHAITEPHAGSDIQAMETVVEETSDTYILNGHKRYITNTPISGLMAVYAKAKDAKSISAYLISSEDSGVAFKDEPRVKGCATATMGDLVFNDCSIPKDRMLGKSGAGATMIQLALEYERAFLFAGISGVMKWQLGEVIKYSRSRRIGSGSLSQLQVINHKIAEMKLRLDTSLLWVERCAELLDNGKRICLESAQTKLYASEAFLQSSLDAAHIMGAFGMKDKMPELVHDAMSGRLFSGSSEVQKNIISSLLGLVLKSG